MIKEEAYVKMSEGYMVTHRLFRPNEYLYMDESLIIRGQDGEVFENDWDVRTSPEWNTDWFIYKGKPTKGIPEKVKKQPPGLYNPYTMYNMVTGREDVKQIEQTGELDDDDDYYEMMEETIRAESYNIQAQLKRGPIIDQSDSSFNKDITKQDYIDEKEKPFVIDPRKKRIIMGLLIKLLLLSITLLIVGGIMTVLGMSVHRILSVYVYIVVGFICGSTGAYLMLKYNKK